MRREPTAGSSRPPPDRKYSGLGGFPTPFAIFPLMGRRVHRYLEGRSVDMKSSTGHRLDRRFTTEPVQTEGNSRFSGMNELQKAELGGVEYRASKLLLKIVLCVSQSGPTRC